MAISEDDLKLDDASDKDAKPSKGKKTIIMAIAGVVVLGLATGAGLYFTGVIGGSDEPVAGATESDGTEQDEEEDAEDGVATETLYHKFKPAFVVNFEEKGKLRFLQIDLSVATQKQLVVDELIKHEPVIRNNLVLLYSSKTSAELNSLKGKEKLREQTREEIQKIMVENMGKPGITDVFFTGFVVQ